MHLLKGQDLNFSLAYSIRSLRVGGWSYECAFNNNRRNSMYMYYTLISISDDEITMRGDVNNKVFL